MLPGSYTQVRSAAELGCNLNEGVTPSARLQNRTGEFPRIRLLNDRVFVTDTIDTASVSFIMAMAMPQAFVAEFFVSSFTLGRNVVNFNDIDVLKEQSTPATFSLLFAQVSSFHPIAQRVVFESLAQLDVCGIRPIYEGKPNSSNS